MSSVRMPPRPTPQASATGKRGCSSDLGHVAAEPLGNREPVNRRGGDAMTHDARTWSCSTSVGKTSPRGLRDNIGASAAVAPSTEETSAQLQACIEADVVKLYCTLQRLGERHRKDLQESKGKLLESNPKAATHPQRAARAPPVPPLISDQPLPEDSDEISATYRLGRGSASSRKQSVAEGVMPCEGPSPWTGDSHGNIMDSGLEDAPSPQREPSPGGSHPILNVWKTFGDEEIAEYLWMHEIEASTPTKLPATRTGVNVSWPSWPSWQRSKSTNNFSDFAFFRPFRCSDALHPHSSVRSLWNVCTLLYVLYDIVVVPLQAFKVPDPMSIAISDFVCNSFWTLDIFMCFKTAIYIGPRLESRVHRVAWTYVRSWFFMDLLIVMLGWTGCAMHVLGQADSKSADSINLVVLLRLCRVFKVKPSAKMLQARVNSDTALLSITIAKIIISLLVLVHLISCTWYWLGESQNHGWTKEDHMNGTDFFYRYFAAARWTIAQISLRTDIELRTAVEYMFTCVVGLLGLVYVSACISQVTNVGIELSRLNKERSAKTRLMHGFLHRHALSTELTNTVMWYFREMRSVRSDEQMQWKNLAGLPHQLHMQVLHEVNREILSAHPYMHDVRSEFPQLMYQICTRVVEQKFVQQQDYLFAPGEACGRMLFVCGGRLRYMLNKISFMSDDILNVFAKPVQSESFFGHHMAFFPSANDDAQLDSDVPVAIVRRGQWISEAALWCECAWVVDRASALTLAQHLKENGRRRQRCLSQHLGWNRHNCSVKLICAGLGSFAETPQPWAVRPTCRRHDHQCGHRHAVPYGVFECAAMHEVGCFVCDIRPRVLDWKTGIMMTSNSQTRSTEQPQVDFNGLHYGFRSGKLQTQRPAASL